jgi:CelD/BcsL family acetyltransferase involved in cellulose biosynthesis
MDQYVALATGQADAGAPEPLFTSAWWLHAASAGEYETIQVKWDGKVVGALPFMRTRRLGMTCLRMPPYTRTLGPQITPPPSKPVQRGANIRRIIRQLAETLPAHDEFVSTLDPAADSAIAFAFEVAGFRICQAFTFRIDPAADLDQVWDGIEKRTRNMIRSAGRRHTVMESCDFSRFEQLSRNELRAEATTHDYAILRALFTAASSRGQALLRFAVREDGTDAAALILVWDAHVMYYWNAARDRDPNGGSNALLLWESIRLAHWRGLIFDFDGYCSPSAARFLAGFAAQPVVRSVIMSCSKRYRMARIGQEFLRCASRRLTRGAVAGTAG